MYERTLDNNDPLYKVCVYEKTVRAWQNNKELKFFLSDEFKKILFNVFSPIGLWQQNPNSHRIDSGVVIDGKWSLLNMIDTNYSSHTYLFNKVNYFLLNLYRNGFNEYILNNGVYINTKEQIQIFDDWYCDLSGTKEKITLLLAIIEKNAEKIFLPKSSTHYNILLEILGKTYKFGFEKEQFFIDNLHIFFNDIIGFRNNTGLGVVEDKKTGVDLYTNHINGKENKYQIKGITDYYETNLGYKIRCNISWKSMVDYFVFVDNKKNVLIFNNDKNKINYLRNSYVLFNKDILYKKSTVTDFV